MRVMDGQPRELRGRGVRVPGAFRLKGAADFPPVAATPRRAEWKFAPQTHRSARRTSTKEPIMVYAAVFIAGVLTGAFGLIGAIFLFIAWQDAKLDMARSGADE